MIILFFLFSLSFPCAAQSEFSIQGDEGKLFFVDQIDDTVGDNVIATFFEDNNGRTYFVDYLPYLSSKGKVQDVFYLNTGKLTSRYFVVQQSQIDSDTGMNWRNYFNVVVFYYVNGELSKDEKMTSYFGSGGDIVNPSGSNSIVYSFPYNEKKKIIQAVSKPAFDSWMKGESVKLKIKGKSYFFPEPMPINKTKSYLVEGDVVLRKKHESGWDYVVYKSTKGREYSGWMLCSLTGSC